MNVENILKLAEVLESEQAENHFNMTDWIVHDGDHELPDNMPLSEAIKDCGTVACIAGWATVLAKPNKAWMDWPDASTNGQIYLGINLEQAQDLFTPTSYSRAILSPQIDWSDLNQYAATPKQAARVLRHLAATGIVDWRYMNEDYTPDASHEPA